MTETSSATAPIHGRTRTFIGTSVSPRRMGPRGVALLSACPVRNANGCGAIGMRRPEGRQRARPPAIGLRRSYGLNTVTLFSPPSQVNVPVTDFTVNETLLTRLAISPWLMVQVPTIPSSPVTHAVSPV